MKIVENWWCPFAHDKKPEYGECAIDKSYWHLHDDERQRLHPDDLNNPIWNEEAESNKDLNKLSRLQLHLSSAYMPPLYFDIDGTFYEIDHREYYHLYKHLFKKAVLDTLVVIDYLHKNSTIFSVNTPFIRKMISSDTGQNKTWKNSLVVCGDQTSAVPGRN